MENTDLRNVALEPCLYEFIESHSVFSSDPSEDDDSRDSQRLLSTDNVEFKLVKLKGSSSYLARCMHYALRSALTKEDDA